MKLVNITNPNEMIHVGDNYIEDVIGAKSNGIYSILFNNNITELYINLFLVKIIIQILS